MSIYRLGIDLAKETFELCGVNQERKVVLRKTLKRSKLLEFIANLPSTTIYMEACGGANYWARKFKSLGHEAKLIPAQYVKPFVKSQKNDRNDALAIVEASLRPEMQFVGIKETWLPKRQASGSKFRLSSKAAFKRRKNGVTRHHQTR